MQINSVRNFGITAFGEGNSENVQSKVQTGEEKKDQVNTEELKKQVSEDKFEKTKQNTPENNIVGLPIPTMSQIGKMQTVQKVLGGTLVAGGVLGALSFLSPKKWVRAAFTVPVGGVLAYMGLNMLNMAKEIDKLKAFTNNKQQG